MNKLVVTGREQCASCMVFVGAFFVKVVGSFDKVVSICGFSEILEDIYGASCKTWYLVLK